MFTHKFIKAFALIIIVFLALSSMFSLFAIGFLNLKTELLDHYGSFIGGILGTLLSFLSVVLVVYTLYDSKEKDRKDRENYEKEKLLYFNYLVSQSLIFGKSYVKGLREASRVIKDNPESIVPIKSESHISLQKIVSVINQEDYYISYQNQIGDGKIADLFRVFETIEGNRKSLIDNFQQKVQLDFNRKTQLSLLVNEINNIMREFSSREENLLIKLYKMWFDFHNYLRNNNISNSYTIFYDQLVKPLIEYLSEILDNSNIESKNLELKVIEYNHLYNGIIFNNKNIADDLHSEANNVEKLINQAENKLITNLKEFYQKNH
ncbi:hypothetical protein ACFSR2_07840 [Emticicia soli]|uniref:Phage abortive infection protein n=2 Tax=Emticicia soli TaxID=2027878 RepID=A0ABW5J6L8_9BACT